MPGPMTPLALLVPKIYYYDFQGRKDVISVAGIELFMGKGAFHRIGATEIDRGQHDEKRQVDYLEGSCLLIRREVLDKIGHLNSDYFAYWEETDLCLRGARAGFQIRYMCQSPKYGIRFRRHLLA